MQAHACEHVSPECKLVARRPCADALVCASFLTFQRDMGVCKYQDVDAASGKRMLMLAAVPATEDTSPSAGTMEQPKCAYLAPGGDDYRGLVNVTGDGTPCLPWPKGWAGKHHGSGLAKDQEECEEGLGEH